MVKNEVNLILSQQWIKVCDAEFGGEHVGSPMCKSMTCIIGNVFVVEAKVTVEDNT